MNTEAHPIVKCVVFDLDETLWEGVLLEDGAVSIPEAHEKAIQELVRRGIAVSIASKNELAPAKARLEKAGLWHLFVFPKINYLPKSQNVAAIISGMGLRGQNVAFIDDNDFNLADVAQAIPEIQVYSAEKWSELLAQPQFNPTDRSEETEGRVQAYKTQEKRGEAKEEASSYDDFLVSCDIHCDIYPFHESYIPRVLELVNRTNQLNFTKSEMGRSEEYLRGLIGADRAWVLNVHDKFGDHGVVGFMSLNGDIITDLVFSCRIMSMFIENAMISDLLARMRESGRPSAGIEVRNARLASHALEEEGFAEDDGHWSLSLEDWEPRRYQWLAVRRCSGSYRKRVRHVAGGQPTIFFKGGCDLQPVLSIVSGAAKQRRFVRRARALSERNRLVRWLLGRFVTPRSKYRIIDDLNKEGHNEHSSRLVASVAFEDRDWEWVHSMLGQLPARVLDANDFSLRWCQEEYDVAVFSPLMDTINHVFSVRGTNVAITSGSYHDPQLGPPDGRTQAWFDETFIDEGLIDHDQFIENWNRILSQIIEPSPTRQVVFLSANEQDPCDDEGKTFRVERHRAINDWIRELSQAWGQVHVLDINDITAKQCDGLRDIRHYDRETYVAIADKLIGLLDNLLA